MFPDTRCRLAVIRGESAGRITILSPPPVPFWQFPSFLSLVNLPLQCGWRRPGPQAGARSSPTHRGNLGRPFHSPGYFLQPHLDRVTSRFPMHFSFFGPSTRLRLIVSFWAIRQPSATHWVASGAPPTPLIPPWRVALLSRPVDPDLRNRTFFILD